MKSKFQTQSLQKFGGCPSGPLLCPPKSLKCKPRYYFIFDQWTYSISVSDISSLTVCHTFLFHMNWSIISGRLGPVWWTDDVLEANHLYDLRVVWLLPWLPPRCSLQVLISTKKYAWLVCMIRKMYIFTGLETNNIVRSTTADVALVLLLLSASGIAISMTCQVLFLFCF